MVLRHGEQDIRGLFEEELVAGDFPEVDFAGPVAAGEVFAVGADGEAVDRFIVRLPVAEDLVACYVCKVVNSQLHNSTTAQSTSNFQLHCEVVELTPKRSFE